jgi:peptidoglycan/LPS O-acetylase OafA/YrhL
MTATREGISTPKGRGRPGLRYLPAVDGMRALAVAAVIAYHAGFGWARAGFLGVDVFFVVSGFLITSLLLADRRQSGGIGFREFWRRRALRLLPALFVLLAVCAVTVPIIASDQASRLHGDLLAAVGYATNWRLIFQHQSYFQAIGRPPILQHLWSLAIEEQFYLLWPLILFGLLLWRRRASRIVGPILLAIVGSTVLMAVLYHPATDPSRVYYGTDTRMETILVGAALACVWLPDRLVGDVSPRARLLIEGAGTAALIGVGTIMWSSNQFDSFLYRGGFLLVAVLTALAIAVASHPAAHRFQAVLGCGLLVWIGRRSYGIYLWHWPIFMVTRPGIDIALTGLPLQALRVGLTLGVAELSYRFIERPARNGALGRMWSELRTLPGRLTLPSGRTALVAGGIVAGVAALVVGVVVPHQAPLPPSFLSHVASAEAPPPTTTPLTTVATTTPTDPDSRDVPAIGLRGPVTSTSTSTSTTTAPPPPAVVTAIGDSVMLETLPALHQHIPNLYANAAVSRQFGAAVPLVAQLAASGQLGNDLIIDLGTNGRIIGTDIQAIMTAATPVRKVVFVNVKASRPWESSDNNTLRTVTAQYPNAVLVDWHTFGDAHPSIFWSDGIHLKPQFIDTYARLVAAAVS